MTRTWRFVAGLALACGLSLAAGPTLAANTGGCLPVTGQFTGVQYTQNINAAFASVLSSNAGATAPSNDCSHAPVIGQTWYDTSGTYGFMRQWDGANWQRLYGLDQPNKIVMRPIGGGVGTVAAAATTDVCSVPQTLVSVTGTATITSFGTSCAPGEVRTITFSAAPTLVYSASTILLPTGANVTAQVGDRAIVVYAGAGVWNVLAYTRADGSPLRTTAVRYAGQTILMRTPNCPVGSLLEDGSTYSRAQYPQLFAAIGTSWGGGDGVTTANLPDSRGAFDRGWGSGQSVDSGRTFGTTQDWLVGNHDHGVSISVASNFSSGFSAGFSASGATDVFSLSRFNNQSITAGNNGNVNAGFTNTQLGVSVSGTVNGTVNGTAYGTVSGRTYGVDGGSENRPRNVTAYHCIFTSNAP